MGAHSIPSHPSTPPPHTHPHPSQAGALGAPTVFLFSDTQLKEESFLEDINNILNTGEVPNLFPKVGGQSPSSTLIS
jgi:hypothetical protein